MSRVSDFPSFLGLYIASIACILVGVAAMPTPVIYICAAMLFLGAAPLPYGYYTLLRLVACGAFAFAAFSTLSQGGKVLPWVYVLVALVFNPIVKVHFPKEVWACIDIAAGLLLLATSKHITREVVQRRVRRET